MKNQEEMKMNNNKVTENKNFREKKEEKAMDILRPCKIKSLKDKEVAQYIKWAVKCKSIEEITDVINSALTPRAKKVTTNEVAQYYMELQQTSTNGLLTKEQLYKMTKAYLESTGKYKCNDYKFLQDNAFIINDMLMKLKEPTAYGLSAKIFRKFNRVIATRCIIKHFKKIGIYVPLGDKQRAIQRCGSHYRQLLNKKEQYNKNQKKGGRK